MGSSSSSSASYSPSPLETIYCCQTCLFCFACWYLYLDYMTINGKTGYSPSSYSSWDHHDDHHHHHNHPYHHKKSVFPSIRSRLRRLGENLMSRPYSNFHLWKHTTKLMQPYSCLIYGDLISTVGARSIPQPDTIQYPNSTYFLPCYICFWHICSKHSPRSKRFPAHPIQPKPSTYSTTVRHPSETALFKFLSAVVMIIHLIQHFLATDQHNWAMSRPCLWIGLKFWMVSLKRKNIDINVKDRIW